MNKRGNGKLRMIFIVGTILVVCFVLFFIFDKATPYSAKDVVMSRLTEGVVEMKKEPAPEEKVVDAVNTNRSRVVNIYALADSDTAGKRSEDNFLARGIIYSQDGAIVTTRGEFQEGVSYAIEIPGKKESIVIEPTMVTEQFVTFKVDENMSLAAQLDRSKPSKGDMVVALGGKQEDEMATGEVFLVDGSADQTYIITTIPSVNIEAGAPLMNTDQDVVGLYVKGSFDGKAVFISADDVVNAMDL